MNKSHRLFRDLGEIPDDYIDDAVNGKPVIKHKNQGWKAAASAAAVFAAVAVIPAAAYLNRNNSNDRPESIKPAVTTYVTTDAVVTSEPEPAKKEAESVHEYNAVMYGTGPERPDYTAEDMKYSTINKNWKKAVEREAVIKLFDFISDKDFVVRMVDFIEKRSAVVCEELEKMVTANDMEEITDYFGELNEAEYFSCEIQQIINGYMTVEVTSWVGLDYSQVDVYMFDIIEGRIIEKYSDMFWNGVNISEKFTGISDQRPAEEIKYHSRIKGCYGIRDDAYYFQLYYNFTEPYIKNLTNDNCRQDILSDLVCSRYRDMSSSVNTAVTETQWKEWYPENAYKTQISGYMVSCGLEVSRFSSEDEILEHNSKTIKMYESVINYAESLGEFPDDNSEAELKLSIKECTGVLVNLYKIVIEEENIPFYIEVYADPSDYAVIEAGDLIKDWKEYIVRAYDYHNDDTDIADPDEYIITNIYHNSLFIVPGTDSDTENSVRESFGNEPYVVVSEDELETFDMISFYLDAYNKNTKERVLIEVYLPVENVESRYFSREGYSYAIRNWYLGH